jgi:tRNA modification GTPase
LDEKLLKKHFLHIVTMSAKTGEGMDKLLELIPRTVGLADNAFDGELITNARQAHALVRAAERCEAALYAATSGMTPDAVVMDAEGAINVLGEITGENITEAVVEKIFNDFCVGK